MSSENKLPVNDNGLDITSVQADEHKRDVQRYSQKITGENFESWYREKQFRENVQNQQTYFNGPSKFKSPGRFTPSELLSCHRKTYYKKLNAPKEEKAPHAIFYFGSKIEEDLVEEFLRDKVAEEESFVQNGLWVNFTIDSPLGEMEINGSTDPVVVDEDGRPILVTEIKTTSNTKYTTEPKETHKAQGHAYMWGLSEEFDIPMDEFVLLYIGRDSDFAPVRFRVKFDEEFWENRVIEWMENSTYYHTFGLLPPADPERDYECDYCSFQNRCGMGDDFREDEGPIGLLPLFEYPRQRVIDYLEAHAGAKLTPALANVYPDLVDEYDAHEWRCDECGSTYSWDRFSWRPDESTPKCPNCKPDSEYLSGPSPEEQRQAVDRGMQ